VIAAAFGLLMLAGCGRRTEFQEFASAEGRFTVLFPGTPEERLRRGVGVAVRSFVVRQADGAYAVSFADLPIPVGEDDEQIQARLDRAREGVLLNEDATLTTAAPITLAGKHPGQAVEAALPDRGGVLRARVYLVDRRLYRVSVKGTRSFTDSPAADRFLDSLSLTP
jgi:hypothetical protein